jgi:integrase
MGATLFGDPEILCGPNGQPLKPAPSAAEPEPPKEPTFSETVARYLAEYAPSALAPSTLDDRRNRLHQRVVPRLGALPVSEAFDVARSRELDVWMVEDGLSPDSRRNTLLAVRSVARFAVEAKILPSLPTLLPLPMSGKRVPSAPSPSDIAAVIDAASYPEHRLVFLLAAHGGLRKGEIRALRCGDCEIERNRIVVRCSRYRSHTGPTKSGHEREVPLTVQLREALVAADIDKRPRDEPAALSTRGEPWGSKGCYYALQSTLRRLALPRVRLHALRAFFVTALLRGHVPAHVVQDLVGHGDLSTTQKYAAIFEGDRGAAVGVLDSVYQNARGSQGGGGERTPSAKVRTKRRRSWVPKRRRELRRRLLRRRGAGSNRETPPVAAERSDKTAG